MFGDRKYKEYFSSDGDDSNMEAGFDSQEEEEEFSRRYGEQEDRDESHRIAKDRE